MSSLEPPIQPTPAVVPAPVGFSLPTLFLKRHEERRLRAGHLWVYSNEVDTHRSPLGEFEPGELIEIRNSRDQALGTGYINPHSLICARLVSRDPYRLLDRSLLRERLHLARDLRERLYGKPFYRLVFGESDGLPGLVVDRYGEVLVVQTTTAGMERCRDEVIAVLDELIRPAALVLRNDSPVRAMERLAIYVETVLGSLPEAVNMEENGVRFTFSAQEGQKTGWFYDQRDNRARLARYVHQRRVLDLFSYVGAWGVQAAVAGARETLCVDASAQALKRLKTNAVENGVEAVLECLHGDAFDVLRRLRAEREKFDVVILDPPAFMKRRKDVQEGLLAYRRLNQMAMQVVADNGILISASCSSYLHREVFLELLQKAARHLDRSLQVLEQGHQAADHPVHPAIPETDYLKVFVVRVLPS